MPWTEIISLVIVGIGVGVLGGLLGIGGSIIMIPVLVLVFDRDQHLAQAAAMIVNIFVAGAGVLRHQRARAVSWLTVRRMLPAGLVCIVVGVLVSNQFPPRLLEITFGVFLVYVVFVNVRKLIAPGTRSGDDDGRTDWIRASIAGAVMGFSAGLLGIGGGIIAVPLLQRVCHLPLRRCIAVSAAVMCITSPLGAWRKNIALEDVTAIEDPIRVSVLIAICFIPTAILGSLLGATLTHVLPVRWIRMVLIALMATASAKYFGLFELLA